MPLERRIQHGSEVTGWSRGRIVNYWARFGEGDEAYDSSQKLLQTYTLPNLFDACPVDAFIMRKKQADWSERRVFEIDGNFGARPVSQRCCCKAMKRKFTSCLLYQRRGQKASSAA
jgi:hypothetical protein